MDKVTDWRKASYSNTNGGACVEVGTSTKSVVVRDTTDREGPRLTVKVRDWRSFIESIKSK